MINDETIEQKAIKLINKYSPWLKENLLIEEHLYEFDDVAGLIELAIAEEREANALIVESLVKHEKQPSVMRRSINQALVFAAIKIRSNGGNIPLSVFPFAPKSEVSE